MEYCKQDFWETADPQTLKQIARTRALTRKYNQVEHSDTEARAGDRIIFCVIDRK